MKTKPVERGAFSHADNIPSRAEHPVMLTISFCAPSIQSCRQHPFTRRASSITANISLRAAYSTFEDSVASVKHVTISRRFVARYCHVAFGWLDCNPHEGAIYSGGRLGIAAAVVRVSWTPLLDSFTQLAHSHLLLSRKFKQYANDSIHDSARHMIPSQFFKKAKPVEHGAFRHADNILSRAEHPVMPTTSFGAPSIKSCRPHPFARRASSHVDNILSRAEH